MKKGPRRLKEALSCRYKNRYKIFVMTEVVKTVVDVQKKVVRAFTMSHFSCGYCLFYNNQHTHTLIFLQQNLDPNKVTNEGSIALVN